MYEEFYRLERRPFLNAPDPDFLHWTDEHLMAFTMLSYGVLSHAPITVVTGEIGAGKTTLIRQLLREMPVDVVVGLVSNMQSGRGELLHWVMTALGMSIEADSYVALFWRFQEFVIGEYAAGRRVIVIVDEAQNLSVEQLEELRMLSNINSDGDELLQIILVGQPQLRELLARPELTQFAQRISSDFHLTPLGAQDVEQYINARLAKAGAQWRIFPERTAQLIHIATRGVPRMVNILCDLALVYGFSAEAKVIDEALLREFLSSVQKRGIYQQFAPLPETPTLVHQAR